MINLINRLKWFVGLVLLQVLILNKMHINGCAIPFLYIYFILKFHSRASRNELVLWGFFLGVVVDMFCNTPGMNAASLTCLAFFRTSLLRLVTLRDVDDDFEPGIRALGVPAFLKYILLSSALFCTIFLCIDTFSFFHWNVLWIKILASTLATMLCVFCAEIVGGEKL